MKSPHLLTILLAAAAAGSPLAGVQSPMQATAETLRHPSRAWEEYPRWSLITPQQLRVDLHSAMERSRAILDSICALKPEEATFENVFLAYQEAMLCIATPETLMLNTGATMDSPEIRAVIQEVSPQTTAFRSSITANERLWTVVQAAARQPWVAALSPAKQRYVQQVCDAFRESGANLSPEKKARMAEVEARISALVMQFNGLLMDSKEAWTHVFTDKADLAGMPEDWLEQSAALAREKGFGTAEKPQWLVTIGGACSAADVQERCSVPATRKLVWHGRQTIGCGKFDTAPVIDETMRLRQELAELRGFANYADMVAAHRMVKNGQTALDFVNGLIGRLRPQFERETSELLEFAAQCTGKPVERLEPWDETYYEHLLRMQKYDVDGEALRPYFEAGATVRGMFGIASSLYGLEFREVPTACVRAGETAPAGTAEVWHPDVRLFELHDTRTGHHLGSFYLDVYARTGKRSGAWMDPLVYGAPASGDTPHRPHLALICANLKPAAPGKPALLCHTEVRTLFHEFGHLLHALLSNTELQTQCGSSVAWDFVELPSKLNEYWVWDPQVLKGFARHYETGAPIPDALLQKAIAAKRFCQATDKVYQLGSARLDMLMHMHYAKLFQGQDVDEASLREMGDTRRPTADPHPRSPMRTLNHCFLGGYAAGYYSYKWAEVLAADAFSRFSAEGMLNPATGAAYREAILSRGDSRPADELFRAFIGRSPNPDALLQEMEPAPQRKR